MYARRSIIIIRYYRFLSSISLSRTRCVAPRMREDAKSVRNTVNQQARERESRIAIMRRTHRVLQTVFRAPARTGRATSPFPLVVVRWKYYRDVYETQERRAESLKASLIIATGDAPRHAARMRLRRLIPSLSIFCETVLKYLFLRDARTPLPFSSPGKHDVFSHAKKESRAVKG